MELNHLHHMKFLIIYLVKLVLYVHYIIYIYILRHVSFNRNSIHLLEHKKYKIDIKISI